MKLRFLLVMGILVCATACTPRQTIKPLENFVRVGLEPGDLVTVTTHDGEVHEFTIKENQGDVLVGEIVRFEVKDLMTIEKHAWSRPKSPCGGDKPLGCSVPLLISLASESHSHYNDVFYDACAQHDYCYRHGQATYGTDRKRCDDEFLRDMQDLCPPAAEGGVGKVFQTLDGSVGSRQTCLSVANDYHFAVSRYGEDKYQTKNSSYCEYNGPPSASDSASAVESPTKITK